jgi:ribose transport system substrate-binding protein
VSIRYRHGTAVVAVAGLALFLGACSSSGGNAASPSTSASAAAATVKVDVGTSTPVALPTGKLKIGVFMNAQSNQWQQVITNAEKTQAAKFGWAVTVLDFNYDQQKMMDAMQSAVTNHTYDAWIVNPIDGVASCKMLTETAPQANILVAVTGTTVCGRDAKPVPEMWAPGTYSYNSVAPSADYEKAWFNAVASANPGKQNVAILVGPAANGASILTQDIAKQFETTHPDFHVTGYINTDYTAPTSFTLTQAYLQAHPDTTLLLSIYSPDISQGMVKAVQSLSLGSKIKMSDMGGSQYTAGQIAKGVIQLTMPYYPATSGTNAVLSFKAAQDGQTPAVHVYDEVPGGVANALVVTKANLSTYKPQY